MGDLFRKHLLKSQIYGQIFIYLLTIVLVGFILIYGYNAIENLRAKANQVECLNFKSDLKNTIESISSDFGRVKRADISLCSPYKQACFVETFEKFDKNNPQSNVPLDPIIKDSLRAESGKNIFLVDKIAKEPFYAGNISVALDVFCINSINGKVSLKFEGMGDHVALSQWP